MAPSRVTWRRRVLAPVTALLLAAGTQAVAPAAPAHAATGLTRHYFSASYGNFASTASWVRKGRYTLTATSATTGTVSNTFAQWTRGKVTPNIFDVDHVLCNGGLYCPVRGTHANSTNTWTGTYSFAGTDNAGVLTIRWRGAQAGMSETWTIGQARNNTLSSMTLKSASWVGPAPTDGHGYGSTKPFTTALSAAGVDAATIRMTHHEISSTQVAAKKSGSWTLAMTDLARTSASPTSLSGAVSTTAAPSSVCPVRPGVTTLGGFIYAMSVRPDRVVWFDHFARCLPAPGTVYRGGMHVKLMDEVLDDTGHLVGFVGVEASTSAGETVGINWSLG